MQRSELRESWKVPEACHLMMSFRVCPSLESGGPQGAAAG
jgi:hypothetical protein